MEYEKMTIEELIALLKTRDEEASAKATECTNHSLLIEEQQKQIEDLNAIIATAGTKAAAASATENVEHKGKEYKWNSKSFCFPGNTTKHTAESAGKDPAILTALLAIDGQSVLEEVK
jgi:hypothetical protein